MRNGRQSNFELLRIIAMVMIVFNHLSGHGVMHVLSESDAYHVWANGSQLNKFVSSFARPGGEVGVALFFIITGYFCFNKEKIRIKKVILQTLFYSVLLSVALITLSILGGGAGYTNMTGTSLIRNVIQGVFVPVSGGGYWFVTVYVIVALIAPYLNAFINKYNKKGFVILLLVSWFFWYSFASLGSPFFQLQKGLLFYSLGAFIHIHTGKANHRFGWVIAFILGWIVGTAISYFVAWFGSKDSLDGVGKVIYEMLPAIETSFIAPICAVSLFKVFESLDVGSVKLFNSIAATTFGVYLIHDSVLCRNLLWNNMFKIDSLYATELFPIFAICVGIAVFVLCSLVDFCRLKLLEPKMMKIADSVLGKMKKVMFY